jgi:hypothetical protein
MNSGKKENKKNYFVEKAEGKETVLDREPIFTGAG